MATPESPRKERPSIKVWVTPDRQEDRVVQEVLWGIEEEGVPEMVELAPEGASDAAALAHQAAMASRLGVGVGLDRDGELVLHFFRLPPQAPLFRFWVEREALSAARALGNNAARLVKGIPFKELEEDEEELERLRHRWEERRQRGQTNTSPKGEPETPGEANPEAPAGDEESQLQETVRQVVARVLQDLERGN